MLRRITPTAESLRRSRWLKWLGPRVHEPHLWRLNRRRVARGVALGAFFGLLLPVAQIPVVILAALLLRAHLLAGVLTTFISNPLTFGPIYYAAYQLGAALLGVPEAPDAAPAIASTTPTAGGWVAPLWDTFLSLGQPLLLGTVLIAAAAGALGYFSTQLVWRMRVLARLRRRRKASCAEAAAVDEVGH